ncbi:type I-E CRISPR-associated endoribonuclease Cas2e [Psychromicrobium xiongbiense]|uniref:type I-E CRISPR-associated endoribonuclease Cas2e n=1 Tax=Psychromicrobium xiongbiense TaxID=3051184 RepID=UPI002554E0FE|nr:type I-E CRISPR-associated endoribonuclease Cas2e [Psychromicrobium sp. YIM S02556]
MVVLVLSACPAGLRGYLTRWLLELSAGVFVGRVSKRVRELMWEKAVSMVGNGRAIMVYSARNEQGLEFKVHGHHWTPIDFDGITLLLRLADPADAPTASSTMGRRTGWSNAARRRRFGQS